MQYKFNDPQLARMAELAKSLGARMDMPTPATLTPGGSAGGTAQTTSGTATQSAGGSIPFIRASQEHAESAGIDKSTQMTTSSQDQGAFPIPAYGYLRAIRMLVTCTGGTGSAAVYYEDAPFNALQTISVAEPNGAVILQFNSGYDCYLAMKYGGYTWAADARQNSAYAAPTTGNFGFMFRLPLEVDERDGLGSLPNQNAAAPFMLRFTLSASTTVFTTPSTTLPIVRVRVYCEEWDQPDMSTNGTPNETTPPAMNTTQYWSVQQYAVTAGQANIRLTRMGNFIRNLIFIYRATAGTRAGAGDTNWPNPLTLYWDTRPLDYIEQNNWKTRQYEKYGYYANGSVPFPGVTAAGDGPGCQDVSVYSYDFCHEFTGHPGFENRDLWLPTIGSTRLEVGGTWGTAGMLYVLTNDISVAGNVFL